MSRRALLAVLPAAVALNLALAGCSGTQDGLAAAGSAMPAATAGTSAGTDGPTPTGPVPSAAPSLVAAAGLSPCPPSDASAATVDGGLPDLTLACLGAGPPVRLAGLRGLPAVINVWASWCEPCREELPALQEVAAGTTGRVRFVGVDQSDLPDSALGLLAATGVRYPSVSDPDGASRAGLRAVALPVTLLVRADGTVAHRVAGPVADADALRALLAEPLGVTS